MGAVLVGEGLCGIAGKLSAQLSRTTRGALYRWIPLLLHLGEREEWVRGGLLELDHESIVVEIERRVSRRRRRNLCGGTLRARAQGRNENRLWYAFPEARVRPYLGVADGMSIGADEELEVW